MDDMLHDSKPFRLDSAFQNALNFAFALHQNQARKSAEIPHFAHLMGVASIVLDYGGGSSEVIAALLHDAIEDQGGESTGAVIERVFGHDVVDLVRAVSEDKSNPGGKKARIHRCNREEWT